jgi:hypothetical protein
MSRIKFEYWNSAIRIAKEGGGRGKAREEIRNVEFSLCGTLVLLFWRSEEE